MKFLKILSFTSFVLATLFIFATPSFASTSSNSSASDIANSLEKTANSLKDFQLERELVETNVVDGNVISTYEELPDKFTVPSSNVSSKQSDIGTNCASCNRREYTKISSRVVNSNYNFGWHPDFSGYNRASGYWFSTSKTSFGVSVSYGYVSVAINQAGGSGYFVNADYSRWSRPAVYGVYKVTRYKVREYNGGGTLIRTYYENVPSANSTYVKIKYR
ncbi:hypothetical protein JUJ52_03700 [Virgibacillus sp. AGTR]|uniref:hypothetical protein n=1 Tax=Virgibacillus sp. AGTR TaxID=2812055 RepID=UPI001D16AF15|nr:hypothetical protein [Virgibacillus sp. AGTR]MCC2249063.1 hypothetical protein [Virgibacillus sp. AGTR]